MPKRRNLREVRRRSAFLRPRKRFLIVCEGSKTETHYLGQFVTELRAANVSIDIFGEQCGTDPLSVVEFARVRFQRDRGYDVCFCVIDRDTHDGARLAQAQAIARAINTKSPNRDFKLIISNPAIEYWFLLHFVFTRAPFVGAGTKSAAARVVDALKGHIPSYSKANAQCLVSLKPRLSAAIERSLQAFADAEATGEFNPSTEMHLLVAAIQDELDPRIRT